MKMGIQKNNWIPDQVGDDYFNSMKNLSSLFDHIFIDNKSDKTLFLLHGTGGSKSDFLFLDKLLEKKYNLVSLQGNVNENGMSRFFKRHSFGVFDQESIREESEKLKEFILAWTKKHKLKAEQLYFLGYSNGANILLSTLFYYPQIMKNLVLLHPMLPFKIKPSSLDLSEHKIFVSIGLHDQMIPQVESEELVKILEFCKANLIKKEYESVHEITQEEIKDIIDFLN